MQSAITRPTNPLDHLVWQTPPLNFSRKTLPVSRTKAGGALARAMQVGPVIDEMIRSGLSQKEIGVEIGMPRSSVCSYLTTWRKAVRESRQ